MAIINHLQTKEENDFAQIWKNYKEDISYLESIFQRLSIKKAEQFEVGIKRSKRLLSYLGNPEKNFEVIHITGTSGKGSVASYIHNMLIASEIKAGCVTSPHICTLLERIKINDIFITPTLFNKILSNLKPFIESEYRNSPCGIPSFYEILFAISMQAFFESKLEVAVIEVGIGGKFDSSNVFSSTKISLITSIGFDHTQLLGNTISEIANDKSHIIKDKSFAITGAKQSEALKEIEDRAKKTSSTLWRLGNEIVIDNSKKNISITTPDSNFIIKNNFLDFQIDNIALAIAAVNALAMKEGEFKNLDLSNATLEKAIYSTFIPGRQEFISSKNSNSPIKEINIILDIAHNESKIKSLVSAWCNIWNLKSNQKYGIAIVSIAEDKDANAILTSLSQVFEEIWLTTPSYTKRAMHSTKTMMDILDSMKLYYRNIVVKTYENPLVAFKEAVKYSPFAIAITGSTYLVSEIRCFIKSEYDVVKDGKVLPIEIKHQFFEGITDK